MSTSFTKSFTTSFTTAVVVGNPKPESRTLAAAQYLAQQLSGSAPDLSVDLARLGTALLDWQDPGVAHLVEEVRRADVVVVGSPTYKATFTGLLKVFLDRFPHQGLRGRIAVPLMLGAAPHHALAPELGLRQVLVELGAIVPAAGLYVLDSAYDDPASFQGWVQHARPVVSVLSEASKLVEGVQP